MHVVLYVFRKFGIHCGLFVMALCSSVGIALFALRVFMDFFIVWCHSFVISLVRSLVSAFVM